MKAYLPTRLKAVSPWLWRLLAVVLIGGGAGFYLQHRLARPAEIANRQTVVVERQDIAPQIQASGLVQANRSTNLSPEGAGKIAELFIQEGDTVTEGQVVARMESRQNQAEVERAQAGLAQAQAELAAKQYGARDEEITQAQARVDTAQASVDVAQSALSKARSELTRFQQLADKGAVSANELNTYITAEQQAGATLKAEQQRQTEAEAGLAILQDGTRPEEIAQATAAVAQAEAQLKTVNIQLDETVVRAPFGGVITRSFAETGDFVTPSTAASSSDGAASTSIAELSSGLEIEAKVPEANIAKLKAGQLAEIRSSAYPDEVFTGVISLVAPRAVREDNITVFRIKVTLTTGQNLLRSGMTVRISFTGEPEEGALVIPLAAMITQKNGQTGVYLADQAGESAFHPIQVGITTGTQVEVKQGLKAGDRILLEPPAGEVIDGVDNIGGGF